MWWDVKLDMEINGRGEQCVRRYGEPRTFGQHERREGAIPLFARGFNCVGFENGSFFQFHHLKEVVDIVEGWVTI